MDYLWRERQNFRHSEAFFASPDPQYLHYIEMGTFSDNILVCEVQYVGLLPIPVVNISNGIL
jgi:hypothetical protein